MKRLITIVILLVLVLTEGHAVLKERDLEQTLEILRTELTDYHRQLTTSSQAVLLPRPAG